MIDDQTVDTDYLSQSMSDMLDMTFSSSVSSIFEACEAALEAGHGRPHVLQLLQNNFFNLSVAFLTAMPF